MELDIDKIKELKEKFFKEFYEQNKNTPTTIAHITKEGKLIPSGFHGCHAGLELRKAIGVISGIQCRVENNIPEEGRKLFIEWLLNHSPFRSALLPDENPLEYQCIVGDGDAPANLMAAGLMAKRLLGEHVRHGHAWYDFVSHGVHPSVAFLYAHFFATDGEVLYRLMPGHTGCINAGAINDKFITNFLQNKPINLKQPYKNSSTGCLETTKIWMGHNKKPINLYDDVIGAFNKAKENIDVSPSINPFAASKQQAKKPTQVKISLAMEYLIPIFNKYRDEIND